ncbi:unnamed protein product [Owenia fusiformis]|uniref:Uncharacterized protein n=1 Tax=Owenia fusiformis TaxID=6347 RepID=A0A8S4PY13_OWEFU|nr:unnamed protein product [Owenia fusiformis]
MQNDNKTQNNYYIPLVISQEHRGASTDTHKTRKMEYIEVSDPDVDPIKEPVTKSYIHVASKRPLSSRTLYDCMRELKDSDEEAVVFMKPDGTRKGSITYKRWIALSENLAVSLIDLGVRPGDKVVVCIPNCEENIISIGGLLHCAALPVFTSFELRSGVDIIEMVKDVDAKILIAYIGKDTSKKAIVSEVFCKVLQGDVDPSMPKFRYVISVGDTLDGSLDFNDLIQPKTNEENTKFAAANNQVDMDSPCWVNSTSGSTGTPKHALITHKGIVNYTTYISRRLNIGSERNITFNDRPFSWSGGTISLGFVLAAQEKLVTIDARQTVRNQNSVTVLKILQNEKVTHALLMPYMLYDVVNMDEHTVKKFDLTSFKAVWSGGQRMDPIIIDAFKSRIPVRFCIVYGQAENIEATLTFPSGEYARQHETVGYGLPHVEIAIKDETNTIVPINTRGEICTRGPGIFAGYLNNREKTLEAFDSNGWLHSGDIGIMTPYGYLKVVGRMKDIIKRGAAMVYPGVIERVINEHPSVNQVHIIGVPDPRLYEELCACIRVQDGHSLSVEKIKTWCEEVFIERVDGLSNVPRYYIIMERFPVLASGKIDKITLKSKAIAKLGL